jgi:L-asparaginase / beta-aspartyl-peptidase
MIVITGGNGRVGLSAAVEVLRRGGSALDAVEAGIQQVELNAADHSVGLGGYPNVLGEVELDAGIMEGRTRAVGAVAALRGYVHPISVARQVLLRLPHVLLVGAGAERFAAEIGAERRELLTAEAEAAWRERLAQVGRVSADEMAHEPHLVDVVCRLLDPRRRGGTVDFIALDAAGDLASGVSTSGFAWKYPGRVGDSPLAGAGYYADNRYGAAGCTGTGEMAIRAGTALRAVLHLQGGAGLQGAGQAALADLHALGGEARPSISLLLLDPRGRAAGFCTGPQGEGYLAMTPDMAQPEERPWVVVPAAAPPTR